MSLTDSIKELRERTGISIAECKKALDAAGGDISQALAVLKERGAAMADKKSDREIGAGVINSYIHAGGAIGVLVELDCETDFVSKNEDFRTLAGDIAMHVAAMKPTDITDLMSQEYIKDPSLSIENLVQQATQKFGERVVLSRFSRFEIGA